MVKTEGGRRRHKGREERRTLELPEAGPFILQGLGSLPDSGGRGPGQGTDPGVCQIHGPIAASAGTTNPTPNVPTNTPNGPVNSPNRSTDTPNGPTNTPNVPVNIPNGSTDTPNVPTNTPNVPVNSPNGSTDTPNGPGSTDIRTTTKDCSHAVSDSVLVAQRSKSIEDYVERLKTISGRKKQSEERGERGSRAASLRHDTVRTSYQGGTTTSDSLSSSRQDLQDYTQRLLALSSDPSHKHRRSSSLRYSRTADRVAQNGPQNGPQNGVPTSHKCSSSRNEGRCSRWKHSPRPWFAVACFLGSLTFLFSVNTDLLPAVNTLALENLLPLDHIHFRSDPLPTVFLITLWGAHFLRRFTEILFLHDYRRRVHPSEAVWINLYYSSLGFWIGWSCNYYTRYRTPKNYILVPAGLVFLMGEVGNCLCHVRLRRLRQTVHSPAQTSRSPGRHVFPAGGLFRYVACPHYLFEACTWLGFAVAVFTLPAFVFLGVNFVTLFVYAWFRKRQYRADFDGRDGAPFFDNSMKVLIPKVF